MSCCQHTRTHRYKRQQLVQLQQLDGKRFFVNLKELAPNCSCMLLAHNPAGLQVVKASKRLDTSSIQAPQLLLVDSPEPVRLVACLSMGPQHAPLPPPPAPKQVHVFRGAVVCAKDAGVTASTLPWRAGVCAGWPHQCWPVQPGVPPAAQPVVQAG
jgi:hypothetical protein